MKENIAKNVMDFLQRASSDYGRIKTEEFSQSMFSQLLEGDIESPIEDLFFVALNVMSAALCIEVNPDPWRDGDGKFRSGFGLFIETQEKIGNYRVDFLISYADGPQPNRVIVELDGHDFHDKNKTQRAYEKKRDRFFVSSGYRVLHFTGSEVVADPYRIAFDVLEILGANRDEEYNATDPFNLGVE